MTSAPPGCPSRSRTRRTGSRRPGFPAAAASSRRVTVVDRAVPDRVEEATTEIFAPRRPGDRQVRPVGRVRGGQVLQVLEEDVVEHLDHPRARECRARYSLSVSDRRQAPDLPVALRVVVAGVEHGLPGSTRAATVGQRDQQTRSPAAAHSSPWAARACARVRHRPRGLRVDRSSQCPPIAVQAASEPRHAARVQRSGRVTRAASGPRSRRGCGEPAASWPAARRRHRRAPARRSPASTRSASAGQVGVHRRALGPGRGVLVRHDRLQRLARGQAEDAPGWPRPGRRGAPPGRAPGSGRRSRAPRRAPAPGGSPPGPWRPAPPGPRSTCESAMSPSVSVEAPPGTRSETTISSRFAAPRKSAT